MLREQHTVSVFDMSGMTHPLWGAPRFILYVIGASRLLRKSDIIWCWFADYPVLPFMLIGKLFCKRIVIFIGDYELQNEPAIQYGNQRFRVRGAITRWILRNADAILVPSPQEITIVRDVEARAAPVTMVPWYVDEEEFIGRIPKTDLIATATFSKFSEMRKGIPIFIESTTALPHKSRVLTSVSREEYIKTLQRAKVYCQLTYPPCESFGVSLLEAMYCGCVPVITPCEAMEWVMGGSGHVVPYGDIEKTRDAIIKAFRTSGEPARKRAREFTKENRREIIKNLISQLSV